MVLKLNKSLLKLDICFKLVHSVVILEIIILTKVTGNVHL